MAGLHDLQDVLHLQRIESNRLGFLTTVALRQHIERGWSVVARWNGDLIGYVLGWRRMRYAPWCRGITQLCVHPDCRRRGVAGVLVDAYGDLAVVNDQSALQAWTRWDLHAAHAMWKRFGWKPVAVREPTTARGKPAVLYRKSLTAIPHPDFYDVPTRGGWNAATIDAVSIATWQRRFRK